MNLDLVKLKAEEVRKKYNPENVSPFPYENVTKDKGDVTIYLTDQLDETTSGAIVYDTQGYTILINKIKSSTRQHFTIAHELGHYFLHPEELKKEAVWVDTENSLLDVGGRALYRLDDNETSRLETEANNFAAELIMPSDLVRDAWNKLKSVEECAKIFNVSVSAMSIKLERIGLL